MSRDLYSERIIAGKWVFRIARSREIDHDGGMTDSYHHGALRDALVQAALGILEEGEELSLRGVARRAGVSHAAPYHHFADRRALLAAVAAEGLVRLRSEIAGLLAEGHLDGGDRMVELGVGYVRFALNNPHLFRLIFSAELSDRAALPDLQESFDISTEMLHQLVARASGETDPVEIRYLSLRAWATAHGLANLLLDQQILGVLSNDDAEGIARRVFLTSLGAARTS